MVRRDPTEAIRSILVVLDGTPASNFALSVACETARRAHATLFGVHVIEVPRSLPVDAELTADLERGEQVVAAAEKAADRHDLRLQANIVQARQAGTAIVEEAAALGVDAVVMGLEYHRSYGQYDIGATALYVLENAASQVWVIRYPPRPDQLS